MAGKVVDSGPMMDWTRDNQIYTRYRMWKAKVELHFSSIYADYTMEQKSAFLRLWMGDEGLPLIMKWTDTGRLDFSKTSDPPSSGYILQTYWDLLEEELKPKGNRLISIQELFSDKSRQGSRTLNNWLTYVYNLVESCNYGDSKERIIRDILFVGCSSQNAKDSIVRKGEDIKLQEVLNILQMEESTRRTLQMVNSEYPTTTTSQVHYASYENNKKSKKKHHSTEQNTNSNNSTKSSKSCFRCGKPYFQGHDAECKAKGATCNECFKTGHFQIVCGSLGRLPKRVQKPNSTDTKATHYISDAPVQAPVGFYNEQGNWVAEPPRPPPSIQAVHSLSVVHPVIQDIQDIQDIHPEANPETSLTQGMAKSQISFRESKQTFSSSKKQVSSHTGSKLHANLNGKAAYTAEFDQILQFFRLTDFPSNLKEIRTFRTSTEVSVQSFRDTETDPETTSNAETGDSKKFQVSNFRNDLQRKGEVMLSLPIDSTQFQQFCKELNDKELFLCRDLLEKEIYGK